MKFSYFVFIVLFSLLSDLVVAQEIAVSHNKMNVMYIGVDNPLTIVIENHDCDDLIVGSLGGKVVKTGDCNYTAWVEKQGEIAIIVGKLTEEKIDTLGKFHFRVKRIPNPVAEIARKNGGTITRGEFRVQRGIAAVLKNFDFDAKFRVINFNCSIKKPRDKNFVLIDNASKSYFEDKILDAVQNIKEGDVIMFHDIEVKGIDGSIRSLDFIVFEILDRPKVKKSKEQRKTWKKTKKEKYKELHKDMPDI